MRKYSTRLGVKRSKIRRKTWQPSTWPVACWIALIALIGFAIATFSFLISSELDVATFQNWLQQLDSWQGITVFIVFVALAIVIGPIPSTPFTVAAGLLWGPLPAGLYGSIGVYLGCVSAYWIGRTLGRSAVQALTGKAIYLSKRRGERYLSWVIWITHLIPVFPFDLVSYGAGISGLPFKRFALPCLLGVIPCTLLLTHAGAALTLNIGMVVAIALVLLILFGTLIWGVRKYNWFALKEIIVFQ